MLSSHVTDAFGTTVNNPTNTSASPFGFGGQFGYYTDEETGLVLCTHRYYSTKLGRWLTRDPIGYEGGINLYGFVNNNPIENIDPLGHKPLNILGDNSGFLAGLGIPLFPLFTDIHITQGATFLVHPTKDQAIRALIHADRFVFWGHGSPKSGSIWINPDQVLNKDDIEYVAAVRSLLGIPKMKHARLFSCFSTTYKDYVNAWLKITERVEGVPEQTGYPDRWPMLTPRGSVFNPMGRDNFVSATPFKKPKK